MRWHVGGTGTLWVVARGRLVARGRFVCHLFAIFCDMGTLEATKKVSILQKMSEISF